MARRKDCKHLGSSTWQACMRVGTVCSSASASAAPWPQHVALSPNKVCQGHPRGASRGPPSVSDHPGDFSPFFLCSSHTAFAPYPKRLCSSTPEGCASSGHLAFAGASPLLLEVLTPSCRSGFGITVSGGLAGILLLHLPSLPLPQRGHRSLFLCLQILVGFSD